MISKQEFSAIVHEVRQSLKEAFDFLKINCVDHNYILYLADGDFKKGLTDSSLRLNPYTIDNAEDRYKDETRLDFFIQFMKTFYSFPKEVKEVSDNEYRLTMELMVYSHIWESTPFLKQLYRLAQLTTGASYPWEVSVPEMAKHKFIREDIRNVLKAKRLKLATVISKGFHTSLRNAFAHSEYHFDKTNRLVHLDTFKGGAWDIKEITYDDWSKRFVYTALLSYHYLDIKYQRRHSLPAEFGESEYLIIHPITANRFRVNKIYYDSEGDRFSFYNSFP